MLFRWDSELLQAYRTGDIIVEADSVEEARMIAKEHFANTHPAPTLMIGDDDWEQEEYKKKKGLLEKDLSQEPMIISSRCIFISGSE